MQKKTIILNKTNTKGRTIFSGNKKKHVIMSSSAFFSEKETIGKLMFWVILGTIPGIVSQIYFFSIGVVYQILLAIITALISEVMVLKLRKLPIILHLKDNSSTVTALLLAISIPPLSPWWVVVFGTIFSILIGKHVYGGLGQNLFNPAMIGYVVLLISFPIEMTSWLPPINFQFIHADALGSLEVIFTGHTSNGITLKQLTFTSDGITQSTPLDCLKIGLLTESITKIVEQPILQGLFAGMGWELVNVAYLFGGIILVFKKIIKYHIPLAFLTTLLFFSLLSWLIAPSQYISPVLHLFSGATMLGAFFIATDSVTSPITNFGRIIYGGIIGLLIWIIRVYGGYPDAVSFSVLLANTTVPLIDQYTQPRVYGHK